MRVIVDANPLFRLTPELGPTGVGRWTAGAVEHLARAAPDWQIDLVAFHLTFAEPDLANMPDNVSFHMVKFSNRLHRRLMVFGLAPKLERFVGNADVMLGPAFVTWPGRNIAEVPVVHDLTYLKHPSFVSSRNLIYLRALMHRVVKRSAAVVTVSSAMRDEISASLGVDASKIAVVPNGCDRLAFNPDATPPQSHPGVPERYLLFVGTLEPRKNLEGVLDALDRLSDRVDVPPLVVVGGSGWRTSALADRLRSLQSIGRVVLLGYVNEKDLPGLYVAATALVTPSFYEGFGLPLLEAMATGTPVVASNIAAHREVGGDAAVYVDPRDADSMASGIESVLGDPNLRERLSDHGPRRADRYTWERTGATLKEALEKAAARR